MPNATSTPSASSDRTRAPAPEAGTGAATAGAALAAAATVAGLARWARVSGVGGLVMADRTFSGWSSSTFEQQKRPSCGEARDLAHSRQVKQRECAQISTRDAKHMDLRLPHLTRRVN